MYFHTFQPRFRIRPTHAQRHFAHVFKGRQRVHFPFVLVTHSGAEPGKQLSEAAVWCAQLTALWRRHAAVRVDRAAFEGRSSYRLCECDCLT